MQVEERRSYFTEYEKVISYRTFLMILSVVSAFPLLSQDHTNGKFEFKDEEVLL